MTDTPAQRIHSPGETPSLWLRGLQLEQVGDVAGPYLPIRKRPMRGSSRNRYVYYFNGHRYGTAIVVV